jgi:hypothetical protein
MKFNINDYPGEYAMHCKTAKEARSFCDYLKSVGRTWCTGLQYDDTAWGYDCEDTVYFFNNGTRSDVNYAKSQNCTILEWEDFMNKEFTKGNLKTGDVVLRRNGNIEIVNRELGMLICSNGGWNDLDDIREDLTAKICGEQWDIVEVRRPTTKSDCCFNSMKYDKHEGTLVYERKEPEEMTLAQVCKLLGKEIKIVK